MAAAYGKKSYWDERYSREGPNASFDWYARFAHFKPVLANYLKKSDYGESPRIPLQHCLLASSISNNNNNNN